MERKSPILDEERGFRRRDFLRALIVIFASLIFSRLLLPSVEKNRPEEFQPKKLPPTAQQPQIYLTPEVRKALKRVKFEYLDHTGIRIIFDELDNPDLLIRMLYPPYGLKRAYPGNVKISYDPDKKAIEITSFNFQQSLANLHQQKPKPKKKEDSNLWNGISRRLVEGYNQETATKLSFEEYLEVIQKIILAVKKALNINGLIDFIINFVEEKNKINEEVKEKEEVKKALENLFKNFFQKLTSKVLVAIILRELLPPLTSQDKNFEAKVNILFFEILLRMAGTQFIEAIPSMHDDVISFGPFQISILIQKNIQNIASTLNTEDLYSEWRNIFNLPPDLPISLPLEIKDLNGAWHYVWFVLNLINFLRGFFLGSETYDDLISNINKLNGVLIDDKQFVALIALIHHLPQEALRFLNFPLIRPKFLSSDYAGDIITYFEVLKSRNIF